MPSSNTANAVVCHLLAYGGVAHLAAAITPKLRRFWTSFTTAVWHSPSKLYDGSLVKLYDINLIINTLSASALARPCTPACDAVRAVAMTRLPERIRNLYDVKSGGACDVKAAPNTSVESAFKNGVRASDTVNRVLLQPHWRREADLAP